MKRRITKIGQPLDCFHCGQFVEYPKPHFEASPGVGMQVEKFCSKRCHALATSRKEGRKPEAGRPNRPLATAEASVATNIRTAKANYARKHAAAEAKNREVIARALSGK